MHKGSSVMFSNLILCRTLQLQLGMLWPTCNTGCCKPAWQIYYRHGGLATKRGPQLLERQLMLELLRLVSPILDRTGWKNRIRSQKIF